MSFYFGLRRLRDKLNQCFWRGVRRLGKDLPLEQLPEVQGMLRKASLTVLLTPRKSERPIPHWRSKEGGTPSAGDFTHWPVCDACGASLTFVLQLHRDEFPQLYYPDGSNLFQLFECPTPRLPAHGDGGCELWMKPFYTSCSTSDGEPPVLDQPPREVGSRFFPECDFCPTTERDFPSFWEDCLDWWGETWDTFYRKHRYDGYVEEFMSKYESREATKVGGFPSWLQAPQEMICICGKKKEFLLQLSSRDMPGVDIGDDGNIYLFVCRACGPQTIEA